MKKFNHLQYIGPLCAAVLLLGGCFTKPAKTPMRQFDLAPMAAPEHPAPAEPSPIGIRFVQMPSYLLRDSMFIRKDAYEFEYFDDADWAERLNQLFQQTLANNLSALLSSGQVYLSTAPPDRVKVWVTVNVQQFDVDTQGRGTLKAWWQLETPGRDKPLNSGQAHLTQTGPAPHANPQAIATTLSALLSKFSQELAGAIREEKIVSTDTP